MEAFKDSIASGINPNLFSEKEAWKELRKINDAAKEYTVAGLITEYTIRDGKNSGEKIAFLTLEDYSGSYGFRLGDRDYMRLREKLALQRFVIIKIKMVISKDGRVFVNINEVIDLKDAFEKYAKSLSIVADITDIRRADIEFFQNDLLSHQGEHKLSFYLKNPNDETKLELPSIQRKINISAELLYKIQEYNKYQIFLN
nr:hypothetical protein [Riemerella anatipestifer]